MMLQGRFHYPLLLSWRYLIPELFGWMVLMAIIAMLTISAIPDVKRAAVDGGFRKRLLHTQRLSFHQPDKLYLPGLTVPHIPLRTHSRPLKLFFRTQFFRINSATNCFNCSFSLRRSNTSLLLASRMVSPLSCRLPASKKALLHL